MNFNEFMNSPQIRNALTSNDPYGELDKLFGSNPFAKNVINLARNSKNDKQLETIAKNFYKERNMDIPNFNK